MGDVCGADVQKLYLEDPNSEQEPAGYALCSENGSTCKKNGCSCRKTCKGKVNGSTKYFSVCVMVPKGKECITSGEHHVTCAVEGTSSYSTTSTPNNKSNDSSKNESNTSNKNQLDTSSKNQLTTSTNNQPNNITKSSTTDSSTDTTTDSSTGSTMDSYTDSTQNVAKDSTQNIAMDKTQNSTQTANTAMVESIKGLNSTSGTSENAFSDAKAVSNTFMSSSTINSTVMIVIIIIAVVFVALVSWAIRWYCLRRSKAKSKPSTLRNWNTQNPYLTNSTGRSSPSFPAFNRRPREIQTPITGERGLGNQGPQRGRAAPRGYNPNSGRGRRNPAIDLAPNRAQPMDREVNCGYNNRNPYMDGSRRERGSGRGRKTFNIDAQRALNGPRGFNEADMQYESNSGRGRQDNYGMYNNEAARRPPSREPRPKQIASSKPVRAPPNNAAGLSGRTVYTGHNTYDGLAQFAQLAAFEAPPTLPPGPQRPIQSVAVSDAVVKPVRAPAQNAKPPPSASSVSKYSGFYINESPAATEYDILSPKTARSLAPSIASSATTVLSGCNRPIPLQQRRRQQHLTAIDSYYKSSYSNDDNKRGGQSRRDESGSERKSKAFGNYDDSFMSEASSMAWSAASGLSDNSYYHAPPSNRGCIPVIGAPHDDDDDDESEDAYSDWGQSTQQSAGDFRSTAASFSAADASFFSATSDYAD
ncbi:unnamed protein product [Peronospora destructor]|uniref:Uncharacterized protein n=1 Tax=Peronospora destructor TaxID=86335 RepID=A0AAV0TGY8_9STRA|nr:unnamed protein product [Peronospora destructor]